jgi:hypothetical protein
MEHSKCPGKRNNLSENRTSLLKLLALLKKYDADADNVLKNWNETAELIETVLDSLDRYMVDKVVPELAPDGKRLRVSPTKLLNWLADLNHYARPEHLTLLRSTLNAVKPFVTFVRNAGILTAFIEMDKHDQGNSGLETHNIWIQKMFSNMNVVLQCLRNGICDDDQKRRVAGEIYSLQHHRKIYEEI